MPTIGHAGALRRLRASRLDAEKATAVAMVAVTSTTLWVGSQGVDKGTTYLLALFKDKLVLLQPTRRPTPEALLVEFSRRTYRIGDLERDLLNLSFTVSRPYGRMQVRMLRRATYAVNNEVLQALVDSAAAAEKAAAKSPPGPLLTAGDTHVFARVCAAYGSGAEQAVAVAEAQVTGSSAKQGLLSRRPALVLAAFADRLVLLDKNETTHVGNPPVAEFGPGTQVSVTGEGKKHLDVTLRQPGKDQPGKDIALRVSRYGEDRIDALVLDAVLAVGAT